MRTALIIVDMQQGSFTPETPRHDSDAVIERLNALAARTRAAGGLVVHVQHAGPPGDAHHPSAPGWAFLPSLDVAADDLVVAKTCCDGFLDTALQEVLQRAGITRLVIGGCATDFCVDTTIRSALARRYVTLVPADGHTTSDRPYLTAAKIIEHHNAVWAGFISPVGPALVAPSVAIEI